MALKRSAKPRTRRSRRTGRILEYAEFLFGLLWFRAQQKPHSPHLFQSIGKKTEAAGVEVGRGYRYLEVAVP